MVKMYGLFFLSEKIINGIMYLELDMLENFPISTKFLKISRANLEEIMYVLDLFISPPPFFLQNLVDRPPL